MCREEVERSEALNDGGDGVHNSQGSGRLLGAKEERTKEAEGKGENGASGKKKKEMDDGPRYAHHTHTHVLLSL